MSFSLFLYGRLVKKGEKREKPRKKMFVFSLKKVYYAAEKSLRTSLGILIDVKI